MPTKTRGPLRAAIYARQSVPKPDGIKNQTEACRKLIDMREYVPAGEYIDDGVSGSKERGEQTAWAKMLTDARAGKFDVVVVRKLDRLTRALHSITELRAAHVLVVTTDGDLDLTSANGRMMAGILATVAQAEVETKAERRAFSNQAGRELGTPTSGRVPYGYRWVPRAERVRRNSTAAYELDTGSIETDPARKLAAAIRGLDSIDSATVLPVLDGIRGGEPFREALTAALDDDSLDVYLAGLEAIKAADGGRAGDVRRMFDEFLAGVPLGSIARDLTAAGRRTLPTRATPDGAVFRPNTMRRLLLSPYYAGLLPLDPPEAGTPYDAAIITRDRTIKGDWPAIVSIEEWEDARRLLAHPKRRTSPGPSRKWLLSGLAVCGECGEPIRAGGGEAGIHSYRCRSMRHFMRRGAPLDEFITEQVIERLSRPDAADLLTPRQRPDVKALRDERSRLETRRREVSADAEAGLLPRDEELAALKRIAKRIAEIDELLREGVNVSAFANVVGAANARAAWEAQTLGVQREMVDALMTITVHSVGQGNRRKMTVEQMAKTVTIEWRE